MLVFYIVKIVKWNTFLAVYFLLLSMHSFIKYLLYTFTQMSKSYNAIFNYQKYDKNNFKINSYIYKSNYDWNTVFITKFWNYVI